MVEARGDEGAPHSAQEARKTGNAKWRARYRRRLREEQGLIQVNVTVPEGAAPLIKELARRLKDGTWPEFVLRPWDEASRRTLASYRKSQSTPEERERRDTTPTSKQVKASRDNGRTLQRQDTRATLQRDGGLSSPGEADSGPLCPVTVRFGGDPGADDVALIEGPPFYLQRSGRSGLTWTGHLQRLVAQRLRMKLDYRLSEAKPVMTIHNPATTPGPRASG